MEKAGDKRKADDSGTSSGVGCASDSPSQVKQSCIDPSNTLVSAMCTDLYQITMAYSYWRSNKHNDDAVFEAFFRKSPFKGEYCVFAGSDEVLKFVSTFKFTAKDVEYLKTCGMLNHCEQAFWDWLLSIDCSSIKVYMIDEGELVFPRIPLVRVEGPLAVAQLLETTILNLINFPCLIATNASRMRLAATENFGVVPKLRPHASINNPKSVQLLEFGLRRAQGPDGAFSAAKYSFVGGFQASSNVIAGQLAGIPIRGTMAHSFITSFYGMKDLTKAEPCIIQDPKSSARVDLLPIVIAKQKMIQEVFGEYNNQDELLAFTAFASSFPDKFIALVDTYDSLKSGIPNFLIVGLALYELGFKPIGIRLDSGDLAMLSIETRKMFIGFDAYLKRREDNLIFSDCMIVASNDLDEDVLISLNNQGHEINIFAIGTNLVTCKKQPALGCVYKLVEINGAPRIKLSQDSEKITIPSKKQVYRFFCTDQIMDVMIRDSEPAPEPNRVFFCRDPYQQATRANVTPSRVEKLLKLKWRGRRSALVETDDVSTSTSHSEIIAMPTLQEAQERCKRSMECFSKMSNSKAHLRFLHPIPYKIHMSGDLYQFLQKMILESTPIPDIK